MLYYSSDTSTLQLPSTLN